MTNYEALAAVAYGHAETNYSKKDARYDVIVECMELSEIAQALRIDGVEDADGARRWADDEAGVQHEVELNQAWDGPESCIGSSKYEPSEDSLPSWLQDRY